MTNTVLTILSADLMLEYYRAGFWSDQTIYSLAAAHAEATPDKFAIRDSKRRLTYRQLVDAADGLAAKLDNAGVVSGQRVAVWMSSRIEVAIALLACSRNAYMCCPSLHRDHTVNEIVELVERMRAAAVLFEIGYGADAARHDVSAMLSRFGFVKFAQAVPRLGEITEGELPSPTAISQSRPPNVDPNRPTYLAFTSGTTGTPKGVMHSDNTLLATIRALSKDWNLDASTVIYTLSPLSHNLGIGSLITSIYIGGELVVHDWPRSKSLADRIVETGATYLVGVPTHAIDLLSELRSRHFEKLGAVRAFRISGAQIPGEVIAELFRYGLVPQAGFGMTEAGSHHYTLPTDDPKLIIETCGRCCVGYELKIFRQDEPGIEAKAGEIGQLCGRGANLMLGYFNDQNATEDSFNADGWFMTGDLGWADENGYLHITGRKKDVIIRGGHNIYPARIETLTLRHQAIERAAAFPVTDARLGEKVCLAVTFRNGMRAHPDEILAHLDAEGLSKFDMPEYFLQPEFIPLTSSGKVLKRELVSWVQEGKLKPTPIRFMEKR